MTMQREAKPNFRGLPPSVAKICARCMQKRPGDRYSSLAALEKDLFKLMENVDIEETEHAGSSRSWLLMTVGVVVAAGAAAAWVWHEPLLKWFQGLIG